MSPLSDCVNLRDRVLFWFSFVQYADLRQVKQTMVSDGLALPGAAGMCGFQEVKALGPEQPLAGDALSFRPRGAAWAGVLLKPLAKWHSCFSFGAFISTRWEKSDKSIIIIMTTIIII